LKDKWTAKRFYSSIRSKQEEGTYIVCSGCGVGVKENATWCGSCGKAWPATMINDLHCIRIRDTLLEVGGCIDSLSDQMDRGIGVDELQAELLELENKIRIERERSHQSATWPPLALEIDQALSYIMQARDRDAIPDDISYYLMRASFSLSTAGNLSMIMKQGKRPQNSNVALWR
ncbi:hypothetical protein N9H39_06540, partial [Gammaproteobacteria bacterium]|nr:hypothetical protein [Gammaproteobacteria bacterium]